MPTICGLTNFRLLSGISCVSSMLPSGAPWDTCTLWRIHFACPIASWRHHIGTIWTDSRPSWRFFRGIRMLNCYFILKWGLLRWVSNRHSWFVWGYKIMMNGRLRRDMLSRSSVVWISSILIIFFERFLS
jgi:hypothetical protein